jgi:murein DD-endopeptidase MepM/ murein hydrolase activator NlpD
MTAFLFRTASVVVLAATLAACTLDQPRYPIREAPAPSPAAPTPAPAASSAPAPSSSAPAETPRFEAAPTASAVETKPLPPLASATQTPPVPVSPPPQTVVPPPPAPAPVPSARLHPAPPPAPAPELASVTGPVVAINDAKHAVIVEKGDTVNLISEGLMTPKDLIIKANHLKKPYELEVGQHLKIPVRKAYVVQAGDGLYGVARRFSTPVAILAELNGLEVKSRLRPDQKILLPAGARDLGPITASRAEGSRPSPPSRPDLAIANVPPSGPRPYDSLWPSPPSRPSAPFPPPAPEASAPPPSDAQIQIAGRGRFVWPVRGDVLSGFGPKPGGQANDGLDIAAPAQSPVRAAASGDVVYSGNQITEFGNLVLIKHEGGWVTAYGHLSVSEVKIRQHVSQGDEIGQVGQTGGVDTPQLHFEVRYAPSPRDKARPIDPTLVLVSPIAP